MKNVKIFLMIFFLLISSIISVCSIIIDSHQITSNENCTCCDQNDHQPYNSFNNDFQQDYSGICQILCLENNSTENSAIKFYVSNLNPYIIESVWINDLLKENNFENQFTKTSSNLYFNSLFPQIPRLNC